LRPGRVPPLQLQPHRSGPGRAPRLREPAQGEGVRLRLVHQRVSAQAHRLLHDGSAPVIEDWNDFAHSTRGLLIGCAGMVLLVEALMFATGEWSAYTQDTGDGYSLTPLGVGESGDESPSR